MVYLAPGGCYKEVSVDILFSELFCDVESKRAVIVVNVSFGEITQNTVRPIHLFELQKENKYSLWSAGCKWCTAKDANLVCRLRVVRVLVWMELEGQLAIRLLDVVGRGCFRKF